jgi:hypothetical protein
MTVQELIDALSQMNPNAEVRIAHQPSWPFELSVGSVVSAEDALADPDDEDEPEELPNLEVVWIGEGSQIGYLPGAVKSALGW